MAAGEGRLMGPSLPMAIGAAAAATAAPGGLIGPSLPIAIADGGAAAGGAAAAARAASSLASGGGDRDCKVTPVSRN